MKVISAAPVRVAGIPSLCHHGHNTDIYNRHAINRQRQQNIFKRYGKESREMIKICSFRKF